jgi:glycosyltransferase involved in cell wall biosynthesis
VTLLQHTLSGEKLPEANLNPVSSSTKPRNIALLFERVVPSLHARLISLAELANFTLIEFCQRDSTYLMEAVDSAGDYRKITLFQDFSYVHYPSRVIQNRTFAALEQIAPDVVGIIGWNDRVSLAGLMWCMTRGVPAVFMGDSTVHDHPRFWLLEWMKAGILNCFDTAFVSGTAQVDYLVSLGFPPHLIHQGYDAVDNAFFGKESVNARRHCETYSKKLELPEKYFLCSCHFIPKKNILSLIHAYGKYKDETQQPWHLVLIGDGPLRVQIRREIERLGLVDLIKLPGFIQYDELPKYYAFASAFVLASISDPCPLVVNEAMACSLPIILSDRCGNTRDFVVEGKNGFSFDPNQPCELVDIMRRISALSLDELEEMGRESRGIISASTPDNFARNLVAACQTAVAEKRKSRTTFRMLLIKLFLSRTLRKCKALISYVLAAH